jgi:hypothetical protein
MTAVLILTADAGRLRGLPDTHRLPAITLHHYEHGSLWGRRVLRANSHAAEGRPRRRGGDAGPLTNLENKDYRPTSGSSESNG